MYKRFQGTRTLSIEDIPYYIIELEDMLRKYWNLESIKNERERINTKRIVEYTFNLKKVPKPSPVSFSTVLNVVRMMPWSLADEETLKREVARILSKYYSVPLNEILGDDYTSRMIEYAKKYFQSVEGGVVEKSLVRFVGNRGLEEVELCLHGGYLSLLQGGKGGAVT